MTPALEQSLPWINDAESLGRNPRLAEEACREVNTMNATADDDPLDGLSVAPWAGSGRFHADASEITAWGKGFLSAAQVLLSE